MIRLLIVRPEPAARESAAKATALGLVAVVAPLFTVSPLPWEAPDPNDFDAILMTSANAARHGGDGLAGFSFLPCYAVGEATAAAARTAGLRDVKAGHGNGADALAMATANGAQRILHLCGRDHIEMEQAGLAMTRRQVYASESVAALPGQAVRILREDALALLHSPRAAMHFAQLVDEAGLDRSSIALIAISAAAAEAAGEGWRLKGVASAPRDEALLELAAKLCKTKAMSVMGSGR